MHQIRNIRQMTQYISNVVKFMRNNKSYITFHIYRLLLHCSRIIESTIDLISVCSSKPILACHNDVFNQHYEIDATFAYVLVRAFGISNGYDPHRAYRVN